jgi:hypothetical protein
MFDVVCVVLIFIFFGVAHAYVEACLRLKARPHHD